jgi:hypothetical protein
MIVLREHVPSENEADHSVAASLAVLASRGEVMISPAPRTEIQR